MTLKERLEARIADGHLKDVVAMAQESTVLGVMEIAAGVIEDAGEVELAATIVTRALDQNRNCVWALLARSRFCARNGDIEAACADAERAFDVAPGSRPAFEAFVDLLQAKGDEASIVAATRTYTMMRDTDIRNLPKWVDDPEAGSPADLYLGLLENVLINTVYADGAIRSGKAADHDASKRRIGKDIPVVAHSMIGLKRLRQFRRAIETVVREGVPGDIIETGVWRGGACILARGVLKTLGVTDRKVLVADSFEGLPPPDPRYEEDALSAFDFHLRPELAVGQEAVEENFRRYDLLDGQVEFVKGFFRDTMPGLKQRQIAVLRLDGDLYSSTQDVLQNLYDSVPPGGIIIIDDYGPVIDARRATLDFREGRSITEPMIAIDEDGVFWRKQ